MAKMVFLVLALSVFAASLVSAQIETSCKLTQEEIQKDVIQCIQDEPALIFPVLEHMRNPNSMVTMDFICENQNGLVNLAFCLEKKFASCFPSVQSLIMQYLPNRDRWGDAVQFMCAHKKDLLETNCMSQSHLQEFMQCYMGKLTSTMQAMRENHDMQAAVCGIVHSEEQCIKTYHGTCTQNYIDLLIQLLEKLVPYCSNGNITTKNQDNIPSILGSILARGQPLMFQPKGAVKYDVVNG